MGSGSPFNTTTLAMKLALVFIGLLAVAAAGVLKEKRVADQEFLQKQKALLELVWRVNQPVYFQNILEVGNKYNINANLDKYYNVDDVKKFYTTYKTGMLPQEEIFSPLQKLHVMEAIQFYNVLVGAKDLDTFYKTAAWARVHLNSGVFVYALNVALLHRQDTQGLVLPPAYEIYPHLFHDSMVIQKAQSIRQKYANQEQQPQDHTVVIPVNNTYLYPHYFYEDMTNDQTQKQNFFYKYGGDYMRTVNPEARVSYFTEDVALNQWYALFNADIAHFIGQKNQNQNQNVINAHYRRGERLYYAHQQLLARYFLERLSNDLQDIDVFQWDKPIKTGYTPNLRYPNGQDFAARPDNFYPTFTRTYDTELVQTFERRILDAIDLGYILTEDGKKVELYNENGIEILGNLIQATADTVNIRYFGRLLQMSMRVLGHIVDVKHQHDIGYGALEQYSTALRDPLFYKLIHRINILFLRYKTNLPKYTRQEFVFPGIKVENVDVDKLVTYFEPYDVDVTAATVVNKVEDDKDLQILARQYRLNHKQFNYKIDIESDKTTDVIVRVFLGPKYDSEGRVLTLNQKRQKMVEIDRFQYQVQSGHTTIQRSFHDNEHLSQDFTSMRTLYKQVMGAIQGKNDFYVDEKVNTCGFPHRLALPKGKKGGMPFTWFVAITPVGQEKDTQQVYTRCGKFQTTFHDEHAYGYPWDRVIDYTAFQVPNFYEKDVIIFHKSQDDAMNQSTKDI